jgi:hypothetical protein
VSAVHRGALCVPPPSCRLQSRVLGPRLWPLHCIALAGEVRCVPACSAAPWMLRACTAAPLLPPCCAAAHLYAEELGDVRLGFARIKGSGPAHVVHPLLQLGPGQGQGQGQGQGRVLLGARVHGDVLCCRIAMQGTPA